MAISEKNRIKINLAAFAVLAVFLLYAMANQVLSLLQDRFDVYAIFRDSGGVFTNQEVTYRGVTIGQVGRLEVVPDGVRIQLTVDEGVRIPKEGVEARVMFKSAVGEQFVDLLPTTDGEPYLEDGDEIPLEDTSIPVSTQSLLSTLQRVLQGVPPEAVKGAIDTLGESLAGTGQDIATILRSLGELADLFATRAPEIERILKRGTTLGAAFLRSRSDFSDAVEQLVTVSGSLATSTGDLENLLRGTILASDEAVALIREHRPELHKVLVDLAEINELQAEHADDVNRLLLKLPGALGRVNRAFEPETGLIRFGSLFNETSVSCSYGTPRRPPEARGNRKIPKRARCTPVTAQQEAATGMAFEDVSLTTPKPALPARMADWSWSLVYLNGF